MFMRKTLFILFVLTVGLASCGYDDSELWNKVKSNETRIAALEEQCRSMNQDIQSLNTIVRALQSNDYVTNVAEVMKDGTVVGYTITFSKGSSVTVYNGKDGHTPVIGIKKHTDGKYYWTIDGEWVYDGSGTGNRISATGVVPELKIKDDWWHVSYDGGKTWKKLSRATGEDGDSFFSSVTDGGDVVTVVLKDGTRLDLSKKSCELGIRFSDHGGIGISEGGTKLIGYTILNGTYDTVIKVFAQNGWTAKVQRISASEGNIVVTAPVPLVNGEVVVLVYDGDSRTIMRCLDFVYGEVTTPKEAYSMTRHGGDFTVTLEANIDFYVNIPEEAASWLKFSGFKTRSMRQEELAFHCGRNEGEGARTAVVGIENKSAGISEKIVVTQDGVVRTLQSHTVGSGVKVVIMGDGYTKEDLTAPEGSEVSLFDRWADRAMEELFAEEPYKSFRDRFDVYSVAVESSGRNFDGSTAIQCRFGSGTNISGNTDRAFQYSYKVEGINAGNVNATLDIVLLNSSKYAGTCVFWTSGKAVAYVPVVNNNTVDFGRVLRHEAGGHGFAKLGDEYFHGGTVPDDKAAKVRSWYTHWGCYANIDVTGNASEIRWARFLSDPRYAGLVGIYEGGMTYQYGVYRPTSFSTMKQNVGGYNAPSREAIYKRIMKLSEGSGWKYDYETFVAYDETNRSNTSLAYYRDQIDEFDEKRFIPLGEPVVMTE